MKSSLATLGSLALAASPIAAIPLAVPFDGPHLPERRAVVALPGAGYAGLHDAYNALKQRGSVERRAT
jgi:hypothetical protein